MALIKNIGLGVAVALALAGCGGGGSTPQPVAKEQPKAVDMSSVEDTDSRGDAGTYPIPAGLMRTLGDVTYSCAEGGDDCTLIVGTDGTVTRTGGTVTAKYSAEYREKMANDAEAARTAEAARAAKERDEAEERERKARVAAEAKAVYPALQRLGLDGNSELTIRGLFSRSAGRHNDYELLEGKVEHGQPLPLQALLSDRALDFQSVLGSPVTRNGRWAVTEVAPYTDPKTGHTHQVRILNDIEAPEMVTVRKKYEDSVRTESALNDADVINLPTDVGTRVRSAGLPAVSEPSREIAANDNGNVSLEGTYDGIPGKLFCAQGGNNCQVTNGGKGAVTLSDAWRFIPDNWELKVPGEADASYLTFGWWLRTGAGTFEAETYALGSSPWPNPGSLDAFRRSKLHLIGGRASYEGPAVGVYALNPPPGTSDDASWGPFTAKAAFDVDFGGVLGENNAGSYGPVTGAITEFTSGGQSLPWRVDLTVGSQLRNMENDKPSVDGLTVWSIDGEKGEVRKKQSTWEANFYDSKQDFKNEGGEAPDSMAGKFSANYGDYGQMDGAFGAYIKE